jgi:menaquinone-dependent protoporphyrinogen oxidase
MALREVETRTTERAPAAPGLVRIGFASQDGHTRTIARHIAERLEARGVAGETLDLADNRPVADILEGTALMVVVAAVRYGKHLAPAQRFLDAYRAHPSPPPLALASVNLTARKPEKRTADTNPYLKKLIARLDLQPTTTAAFAGKLDYPKYRWLDRQMIRLIMYLTGGPTDGTSTIDYTDWASVDSFADTLIATVQTKTG